jgi:hypothetical protein
MVRLRGRLAESYTVAISIALSLPLKKTHPIGYLP